MRAAALLDDRDRLPHLAAGLEVAEQDDGVGQVAGVDRRVHLPADQSLMGADQQRGHAGWPKYVSNSCSWTIRNLSSGMAFR